MTLTVSPVPSLLAPAPALPDAGGGSVTFAPLIQGLLDENGFTPDCKLLPPDGEALPVLPMVAPADEKVRDAPVAGQAATPVVATPVVAACILPIARRFAAAPDKDEAPAPIDTAHADTEDDGSAPQADLVAQPALPALVAPPQTILLPDAKPVVHSPQADATPVAAQGAAPRPRPAPVPDSFSAAVAAVDGVGTPAGATPLQPTGEGALPPPAQAPASGSFPAATAGAKDPAGATPLQPASAALPAAVPSPPGAPITPNQNTVDRYVSETSVSLPAQAPTRPNGIAITPTALPAPLAPAPVQPAIQAFGAAIRRALADERKAPRADAADPLAGAALVTTPAAVAPVAQPGAALDTADRRWPQAMAEQIERLRDAQNESSTRIRLLPDALGPIDVAVRREGEHVHVHFTAAQAETRQLLLDAQPRLADAADARGLKLGRTEVNADTPSDHRRERQPAPAPQPSRPAPARTRVAAADTTDTRIA